MRRLLYIYIIPVLLCGYHATAQEVHIIPEPAQLTVTDAKGGFMIDKSTRMLLRDPAGEKAAAFFRDYLRQHYGLEIATTRNGNEKNAIVLEKGSGADSVEGAYTLHVKKNQVRIAGSGDAGIFYGIQSLIQLLPVQAGSLLRIPMVDIKDQPRFAYRGLHLDVCRHMFPVSFIKKYIDYIALHKMNYFHWHLTDDQGWRIEIKKYPRLTSVGAWRNGTIIGPGKGYDGIRYGGYYSQEEVKEVVAYAAQRCVTVIPEIEMPGHSVAALAAYPELACEGNPGPFEVAQKWGVFEDVLCPGKEKVFDFMEDVLTEVMSLFPSACIHIGGDECPKTRWKQCSDCQKRIRDNHLKDEFALQSYFIHRIEKFVNSKGRKIIGWNEIIEGGLTPNAVLMSWQGWKSADIEAARQGNYVIMATSSYTYLNKRPSLNEDSIGVKGKSLFLDSVYLFEPVSATLDAAAAKFIWGGQGNIWTEHVDDPSKVEYLLFPRLSALSEVLWTPREKKDWNNFQKKLPDQFQRYKLWGANYETFYFKDRGLNPADYGLRKN